MADTLSPNKPGAVLFDLDGTLVDTAADFVGVLNHQRAIHGLAALDETVIRNTVSNGARALTTLAFGGKEGETDFELKRQELLDLYEEKVGNEASLFPHLDDLLTSLEDRSIPWGIVTNKPRLYTELLLQRMALDCSVVVCPDDVAKSKPDPEGLLLAADHCNTPAEHCIYVGDHERDIEAARRAGMRSIAARYGYVDPMDNLQSWRADFIIDCPSELLPLLDTAWD
jgi:2-phosphoglycolate phosphatase